VDQAGQVVDVLLRSQRDLASAKALFRQAIARRRVVPEAVITDKHRAYPRAVREELPEAGHIACGLHRASGRTTKPVERSHVPIKDRVRPMQGLQGIATGQRILEGVVVRPRMGDKSATVSLSWPSSPAVADERGAVAYI
jgi:putative transposase